MNRELESYLVELERATDLDAHLDAFYRILAKLGFPRLVFSYGERELLSEDAPYRHTRFWSVPSESFEAFYMEREHYRHDPYMRHVLMGTEGLYWREPAFLATLAPRERLVLDEGTELGVRDGYTYPIHSHDQQFPGALTLFHNRANDRAFRRSVVEHDGIIQLATYYLHATIRLRFGARVLPGRIPFRPMEQLTPRECECLMWVAAGLAAWEIAQRLHLAERTVNAHVAAAMQRLGVRNRTQAVAKALALGLIAP